MRWSILAKYSVLMCGIAAVIYIFDAVLYNATEDYMMETCHCGRMVPYEPSDAVPTTTCIALLLPAAAGRRRVTNETSGTRRLSYTPT